MHHIDFAFIGAQEVGRISFKILDRCLIVEVRIKAEEIDDFLTQFFNLLLLSLFLEIICEQGIVSRLAVKGELDHSVGADLEGILKTNWAIHTVSIRDFYE